MFQASASFSFGWSVNVEAIPKAVPAERGTGSLIEPDKCERLREIQHQDHQEADFTQNARRFGRLRMGRVVIP